jgi:hypothetical protein
MLNSTDNLEDSFIDTPPTVRLGRPAVCGPDEFAASDTQLADDPNGD